MAKKKLTADDESAVDLQAELPEPEPEPEPTHEVATGVDPAPESETEAAEPAAATDSPTVGDHRVRHGVDSIIAAADDRSYYLWVDGQRYVHVGEHDGRWVYRPD